MPVMPLKNEPRPPLNHHWKRLPHAVVFECAQLSLQHRRSKDVESLVSTMVSFDTIVTTCEAVDRVGKRWVNSDRAMRSEQRTCGSRRPQPSPLRRPGRAENLFNYCACAMHVPPKSPETRQT